MTHINYDLSYIIALLKNFVSKNCQKNEIFYLCDLVNVVYFVVFNTIDTKTIVKFQTKQQTTSDSNKETTKSKSNMKYIDIMSYG